MHFCEQAPCEDRDAERLCVLHFSLNTPVVAIDVLPVGPARAGIALCEDPDGSVRLEIAIRSLRTGQVIFYAPDEEFEGGRDAVVAVDAALSFAEGMGFLFDEDEIAARGEEGRPAAAARWRNLVEGVSELAAEPVASGFPRPQAEEAAPLLDQVCEVPARDGESRAERVDVRDGDEVVLADIAVPAEAAVDAVAAAAGAVPELALSKFRLVMGAIGPQRDGEGSSAPDGVAVAASVTPLNSRIRLLSRF